MNQRSVQLCTFCKKHSVKAKIKNHGRKCDFKLCDCYCCEEIRICQRFNRANTKNSRKSIGDRRLILPLELIELFKFEKELLDVIKWIRTSCIGNPSLFKESMNKWIRKGYEVSHPEQNQTYVHHSNRFCNNFPTSTQPFTAVPEERQNERYLRSPRSNVSYINNVEELRSDNYRYFEESWSHQFLNYDHCNRTAIYTELKQEHYDSSCFEPQPPNLPPFHQTFLQL